MSKTHDYGEPWKIAIDGTYSAVWPKIVTEDRDIDDPIAEMPAHRISTTGAQTFEESPDLFQPSEYHDEIMGKAERIISCVNACAGIHDPAAALTSAREALQWVINSPLIRDLAASNSHVFANFDAAKKALNFLTPAP